MQFPTLLLSLPLFFVMFTRDWFSIVLLTLMTKELAIKVAKSVVGLSNYS